MNNFSWNEFKESNIAVHCNTKEKTNDFLRKCHNREMKWRGGRSLLELNNWDTYEKNIYYEYDYNGVRCADLDYYKGRNYKIIEWEIEDNTSSNNNQSTISILRDIINYCNNKIDKLERGE